MLHRYSMGLHPIHLQIYQKGCEFTAAIVSPPLPRGLFDSAPHRLMDSSERQPLKWHYFRSVRKNCVAAQLLQQK